MPRVALVVDDSMLIRHTVCRFLEKAGFAVESASNGEEALELLKTLLPDIIITDMTMPKVDGRELITRLKASPQTAAIPIVILTSVVPASQVSSSGSLSSGAQEEETRADYRIQKDIEIEMQLKQAITAALGDFGDF